MQEYERIYKYIEEYWKLLYDYYARDGQIFYVTYYQIDQGLTVWDSDFLMGGAYEKIGPLSGIKWKQILMFPVYAVGETWTRWDAQDIGFINEGESEFVIPSIYGITPIPGDILKFKQDYLAIDPVTDVNSIFQITGVKQQSPLDRTFWQCKLSVYQSDTTTQLDKQVSTTLMFFEYDKKIHTIPDATTLANMLVKNKTLRDNLKSLFDENSGYYLI